MSDAEMEQKFKREGWETYRTGRTPVERALGLLTIIKSHFFLHSHPPSFAVYASHWLWANQARYDREVMGLLIEDYPLPTRPLIQPGYSTWNSYGDPCYKLLD